MSTSSKKIYTKYGDEGQTSLLYGGRVSKTNQHCEAYGATDEGSSALGLARSLCQDTRVKVILKNVERELVTISAELATEPSKYDLFKQHFKPVTPEMTIRLEKHIDTLTEEAPLPRAFILPGGSPGSAAIDLARTVVRRAEREVVRLKEAGSLANEEVLRYLNRLGDLLFVLARYEDRHLPLEKASDA